MRIGLIGAAVFLAVGANTASAIDVDQVLWGFDGQATLGCFNPLSVLIRNSGSQPFSGRLELRKMLGPGARVGAVVVEDVYLGPNSSRWVQFYPYVMEDFEEWSLRWGWQTTERSEIPKPRLGDQAPILLSDPDDPAQRGGTLKRFPEYLFPPQVTATDSLNSAVLDHVPRWESARRQAFFDWLFRGGKLHLFQDANRKFPQFSGELAPLNLVQDRYRVGTGTVFRYPRPLDLGGNVGVDELIAAAEKGANKTADAGAKKAGAKKAGAKKPSKEPEVTQNPASADAKTQAWIHEQVRRDVTGEIFTFLKDIVRPDHYWTLIYVTGIVYIFVLFPGLYWMGRRRIDYRLIYGVLVGLIVAFSLGFSYVGRRGQGERTSVHSLGVARQLADGGLDVTLWSNVFVTRGDVYSISRLGTGQLFSTAQSIEEVRGAIHNGASGRFDVDIPAFSTRPFVQRLKVKEAPFDFTIRKFSTDGPKLSSLRLDVASNFPRRDGTSWARVLYRDQVYTMSWTDQGLDLLSGNVQPLSEFLAQFSTAANRMRSSPFGGQEEVKPDLNSVSDIRLEGIYHALVGWSLNRNAPNKVPEHALTDDRARLFVVGLPPENLNVQGAQFGVQKGRLLYVIDLLKPEKP